MDFGNILDEWEKIKREHKDSLPPPAAKEASTPTSQKLAAKPASVPAPKPDAKPKPDARAVLEAWLAAHEVGDKDADAQPSSAQNSFESRRLAELKPQAVLDLHGMTGEEAEAAIAGFVASSSRMGLEKVLVIHGKGLHSSGAPVLKKAARRSLEANPLAGRFGEADKSEGGSGALWVLIRKRA